MQVTYWSTPYGHYCTLDPTEKRLIAYSALIHDIGKMGRLNKTPPNKHTGRLIYFDVKDHPEVGAEYVMNGELPLVNPNTLEIDSTLDLYKLAEEQYVNTSKLYLVASLIALHWFYGAHVVSPLDAGQDRERVFESYVYVCLGTLKKLNLSHFYRDSKELLFMFKGLIILSIADVLGMQPYGQKRLEKTYKSSVNKKSDYFPISNVAKVYRGSNKFVARMRMNGIKYGDDLYAYIQANLTAIMSELHENRIPPADDRFASGRQRDVEPMEL